MSDSSPAYTDSPWSTSSSLSGLELSRRAERSVVRTFQKADVDLLNYRIAANVRAQKDQIDSVMLGQKHSAALAEELDFMQYGISKAGQSAAALEIVARHLNDFVDSNCRRIRNRAW